MEDPRTAFVDALDLSRAQVEDFPGLIFMCGGPLDSEPTPPRSVRDFFLRWIPIKDTSLSGKMVLAEDIKDWMRDGTYSELITFEKHLAELASVIVVFVESAGAIAELGAFSQLEGVNDKLLVLLQDKHYRDDSFIRLGPVKYLEENYPKSVLWYPWKTEVRSGEHQLDARSVESCVDEIYSAILSASRRRIPRDFSPSVARDRMLLICDLLDLMIGLQQSEIHAYLKIAGIQIDLALLKRYLFVLEKLKLIVSVPRGHRCYYIVSESRRFVRLGFRAEAPRIDRVRFRFDVAEFYRSSDTERHSALARLMAGVA